MQNTPTPRGRGYRRLPVDDLPNRARTLRESLGKKPKEVAKAIGVGVSALTEFELHGRGIGRRYQFLLAEELGVDYGTLLIPGRNFAEKIRQGLDKTTVPAV